MLGVLVRTTGLALVMAAGAWTPMSTEGAPEIGDIADVKTAFLGRGRWWLWNAYQPLTESRVFDARANAWRQTTMAKGPPASIGRSHGVLAPDPGAGAGGELVVYELQGRLAIYALDPETLKWSDLTAGAPPLQGSPQAVAGEGRLVFWDPTAQAGAVFAIAGRRWEPFTQPPPLFGRGYDCSFLRQGAWFVANPNGVFRFDFASKAWTTAFQPPEPAPSPDLGACNVSFSGGLAVAVSKALYDPKGRTVYFIEGAAVRRVPWPDGPEHQAILAAGGTAWTTQHQRFDRSAGKWIAAPLPRGVDPRKAFISDLGGRALLVHGERVFAWNGKQFGPPVSLGAGASFQVAMGGLLATDAGAVRVLDPSGKERLRAPAPPSWLAYRDLSPELMVTWGVAETREGNSCHNPFRPQRREPDQPVCTPARSVTYTWIHPGGSFLLREP